MTISQFIKQNRDAINKVIERYGIRASKLTDQDRKEWIYNEESLYVWAKSENVKV